MFFHNVADRRLTIRAGLPAGICLVGTIFRSSMYSIQKYFVMICRRWLSKNFREVYEMIYKILIADLCARSFLAEKISETIEFWVMLSYVLPSSVNLGR